MAMQYPKRLQPLISLATDGDMRVIHNELDNLFQGQQVTSQMQPTHSPTTALYAAARYNHPQIAKYLIEKGVEIDKSTIIHALSGDSHDVLDVLIELGWDINLCLGHVGDALILATGADNTNMVKFLLARGADSNRNRRGECSTALECAAYSASISTLKMLLDAGAQIKTRSALTRTAQDGRTDVVAYLLDRGADVDEIPDNDDLFDYPQRLGLGNALCMAAGAGNTEVVKLLLERGANKQVRDAWGRGALDLAKLNHHSDCVKILSQGK